MVLHGQPRWNRAAAILGLIATAWFVWADTIRSRIGRGPLELAFGRAIGHVLLAGACGAAIALCVYLTVRWTGRGRIPHPLRSAAVAAWYFPAMVLMFSSPAAIMAGSVLVFATTRLIAARWDRNRPPLSLSVGALLLKRMAVALVCSIAVHTAVGAYARGSVLLAAGLFAGMISTLTALAIVVGAYTPARPARISHSALGVMLIVLLIVGVTIRKRGGGGGAGYEDGGGANPISDDSFPGVILLRELEKNAVLIAPNLKRGAGAKGSGLFDAAKPAKLTQPMDVTFSGEYWMLLPRYRRPPPQSLIERGNPSKLSFATNGGPMVMEAHQPLSGFVDPASCERIELVVAGPDTQDMLAFQLFLLDTDVPDPRGEESLGYQFVRADPSRHGREAVSFSVPLATRLKRFNEIKVVFRRPSLMSKSVKLAVERMTIVPR